MSAADHKGECLPPAENSGAVEVTAHPDSGSVAVAVRHGATVLAEPEVRGLICELSAAWSRAFDGSVS